MTEKIFQPAGGWSRIAAVFLDCFFLLLVCVLVFAVVRNVQAYNLACQILIAAYFIYFEGSLRQATPGKRAMKIFVATKDGKRLSWQKSALRYLAWIVFSLPYIFLTIGPRYASMNEQLLNVSDPETVKRIMAEPQNQGLTTQLSISLIFYILIGLAFYFLPMFFSKEKAGLHDRLTGTQVFKRP
ncbi:MAG: RDD family protein [Alphaproteobacteria bacterium]|nr:RDD family protein [Alphaproteobacteria bacterium]